MTPIDWKQALIDLANGSAVVLGRQSLVTPIDWKLGDSCRYRVTLSVEGSPILGDAY